MRIVAVMIPNGFLPGKDLMSILNILLRPLDDSVAALLSDT
jgi:hypothetical protein